MDARESAHTSSSLRPVLVMVDFSAVRTLAGEIDYSDIMEATRRISSLPLLKWKRQQSTPCRNSCPRLLKITVRQVSSEVSDQIWATWHIHIDPAEMEMSLSFPVHRHGWVCQQDRGPSMDALVFTSLDQPYIMRLICHRAIARAACHNVPRRCVSGTESVSQDKRRSGFEKDEKDVVNRKHRQ